ncbi:hypothetical protein BC829DRAFT_162548 [Chytridium lagenaria]|nr:hypothetical protein BC829DRAFT_162548 [Chytridium lagenaria]
MTNEPRSMAYPGAGFENIDPISDMAVGVDARPRPQHFHIMLPDDAVEANHWIVATLAAFHLDADLGTREKEIEDGEVGVVGKETAWGLLYLSPDDIAGLAMSPETLGEVKLRFAKVFNDKSGAKRAGYLEGWNDAVGQGTTARNAYERQEIEGKAKGLVEWLTKAKEEAGGGKLKSKKESMISPIINVTEPTVERKTADVEKKKSKRLSAISATSQVSEKRISRKKTTDSRKSTKSVELKSVVARESLEEEGDEVDENGEKMKKHEEGEDGVEGDEDSDKSDSATGESGEGGSTEESDGDEESSEIDENDEEKSETDSESKPAGPVFVTTDLVLLALPILQPNGIWIWQYQFADKETYQPQPNMEIVAQAPAVPFDKKGIAVAMERDDESDEEDGDDGEESSGDDEDDGSEESSDGEEIVEGGKDSASIRRGSLLVAGAPGVGASSAETEQLIPPKKSKKAAVAADGSDDEGSISEGSGSGTESGESGESEEEDDEEYEEEQPDALRQPLLQQNMMIPGLIPGLLPLQPGFMLPNMMGQTPMPMTQDGMQVAPSERSYDDDDDDDAPVSREKFRLFAENSLLAQLPDKTPDGMLVDKRGSSRPSGPLVRLDADTLEVQERAMTHRQALAAKVAGNKDTSAVVSRQHNHGHHDSGPLIGIPASTKPKISGGLLAEVDRREKEKEMLKKWVSIDLGLGTFTAATSAGCTSRYAGYGRLLSLWCTLSVSRRVPYPPPMYGGYPYPAYPYGPYPPPHMQQMPGGMPPNIQQGMSPNMPPNIGPNMPPGMPPQMQYPVSEWGEAYDDPMIVHHANVLREQWLESERMKERQRILEEEKSSAAGPIRPSNMQPQQYLQRPPTTFTVALTLTQPAQVTSMVAVLTLLKGSLKKVETQRRKRDRK